jgi:hypothetical protein
MYIKALIEAFHDLRPGASSLAYKEVQTVISTFGIRDKDQYFHPRNLCNNLQKTRGIYEMVFGLIGGVREVIKPPQNTAKDFLHQVAQTEPRMLEFVLGEVQDIEPCSKEINFYQVWYTTVNRLVRMKEAAGPTKSNSQSEKIAGDKSATTNPAFKDGVRILCQICGSKHSAKDCPEVHEALKPSKIRRGKFLPGQSDQDSKQRGARVDSDDEPQGEICLISKLRLCPKKLARNHATKECGRVPESLKKETMQRI